MNDYDYSAAGFALTRSFEGLRLSSYQDSAGIWTIGYGHTGPEVRAGQRITEGEAEALLRADLSAAIHCVRGAVRVAVSQNQFDALVDFCFNAGRGSFLGSTLLRCVNRGDFAGAAGQFGLWVHAGGEVVAGLVRRRAAEAALFAGSDGKTPQASTEVGVREPGSVLASSGLVTIV
ncbi:MAG TPA: lysozyme [Acidobacteriaceae bacterium]|jgi:lysozyme